MSEQYGWSAYPPLPADVPPDRSADEELRPELADIGRLARRGLRAVIGAARG